MEKMKKDNVKEIVRKELFSNFYNIPKGTIGAEIELPIVSKTDIKMENIQKVFKYLIERDDFVVDYNDNDGNVISVINKINYDKISLEYSVNTLEFSLKEDYNILNIKNRFDEYIIKIQDYFKPFTYELVGSGINPNYKTINRHCLNENRYLIIEKLLKEKNQNVKIFNEFCSYVTSTQTHITPSINELPEVMNVFSGIEWIKGYLYANSYMKELDNFLSRDYLWKISNFEEVNVGANQWYSTVDDIINDYMKRKMHIIKRENNYYLVESKTIEEYYLQKDVLCRDYNDNIKKIKPKEKDIHDFRSYKNIEVTRRGTLEIRCDCSQALDNLFEVIAFNIGIFEGYKSISNLIKKYNIKESYIEKRNSIGTMMNINKNEERFLNEVIKIVYDKLKERGYGEESLLKKINERRI